MIRNSQTGTCLAADMPEFRQVSADIGGSLTPVAVDETGIAWKSDMKDKFGSQDAENFNTQADAAHRGGSTITGESLRVTTLRIKQLYTLWFSLYSLHHGSTWPVTCSLWQAAA